MSDNMREAWSEAIEWIENNPFGLDDYQYENWYWRIKEALSTPDTYRVPDETTHPFAPVWFTYPGAGGWFPSSLSEMDEINRMFRCAVFVLAKENQGPPPEDWRPE